ncbi:C-type mannose receptor 2-like [Siniperca chuatsi]|uniref:C-type mannose receptor 2-like n=1 Tax=Siniperca chuatsi TaxID=119488 RepID=UPI001CE060AB|nr:C-type mannose receptor 2-like [Siniperca chuatsi]
MKIQETRDVSPIRERMLSPSQKPQIMERRVFGILVLSGLCHFASSLHHRQYHFISEPKTWPEAQQYCREKHTDLATVNNVQDLEELAGLINSEVTSYIFLGLYRSWGWSVSDADDYKEGELGYWNWASGEPVKYFCGSIGSTGEWFATNCNSSLNFFCYNVIFIKQLISFVGSTTDISQRFILGQGSMDWLAAQAYCRTQHTDLARVRNQLENEELQKIVNNGSVWIGLTGMSWMWSDGSEPSFAPWRPFEPLFSGLDDCAILEVNSNSLGMTDRGCDEKMPFFCYSAPQRKHLVRLKLTADISSVDMTDSAEMESILKWVERKLRDEGASEGVKLSWRKLPKKEKSTKQEQTKTLQTHEQECVP